MWPIDQHFWSFLAILSAPFGSIRLVGKSYYFCKSYILPKGPFKYYVIKEVGGWGQKMATFDDLQYCKSSKKWLGGSKNVKNMMT